MNSPYKKSAPISGNQSKIDYISYFPSPLHLYNLSECKEESSAKLNRPIYYIRCPSSTCKQKILFLCPICHKGNLTPDEELFQLRCDSCHHTLKQMHCRACGQVTKAELINKLLKKISHVQERGDRGQFIAVLIVCLSIALCLLGIISFQETTGAPWWQK